MITIMIIMITIMAIVIIIIIILIICVTITHSSSHHDPISLTPLYIDQYVSHLSDRAMHGLGHDG
jgi:hypothetical protein